MRCICGKSCRLLAKKLEDEGGGKVCLIESISVEDAEELGLDLLQERQSASKHTKKNATCKVVKHLTRQRSNRTFIEKNK